MKMNKRRVLVPVVFITIAVTVGLISTISGFRLADAKAGTGDTPDQLIGVLVTDGSWPQSISESGATDFLDNSTQIAMNDRSIYPVAGSDERIYATIRLAPDANGDNTQPFGTGDVTFEGMNGVVFFLQREEEYLSTYSDNNLFDVGTWVDGSEQKESITIEGSIGVLPTEISDASYFFHPIFQSNDGRIYVSPGDTGIQAPGAAGESSQALSVKNTESDSDKDKSSEFSVKVNLVGKYPPISITILQADDKNEVIARQVFEPGQLPETLLTEKGTEYLIVEENATGADGLLIVNRTIINRGEEYLLTHYKPENSKWISAQEITLGWQD